MIAIWSGEPGAGKTWNAMQCEEPIEYWDLEKRGELTINQFPDQLIDLKDLKRFTTNYRDDHYQTYLEFSKTVEDFLKKTELPQTLVVDGISDVRNHLALAKWQHDTGKKKPGEYTWGVINDITKNLLSPLINMSIVKGFDLIFTAQFVDKYTTVSVQDDMGRPIRKSAKNGRVPATKDWQNYGVNTLVELSQARGKYYAKITKSPVGIDEFEITGLSLFDELINRGI